MKKRVLFILACFWIIISFLLIRTTYAKYLTSVDASADVGIAIWNVVINNQDILTSSNFSTNLSLEVPGTDYYIEDYIVPGAIGYFDIEIDTDEVTIPFKYTVTAEPDILNDIDDIEVIGYSLNGNNQNITYLSNENTEIANTVYPTSENSSIRIYIKWNDDSSETLDDDEDTEIALDEGKAAVRVNVLVEQIPDEVLEEEP